MNRKLHTPPPWYIPRPEPISDRYQAEVDAATGRLETRHRKALRRVEKAKRRASAGARQLCDEKYMRAREREVEQSIRDLADIERLMQPGSTASAAHRGVNSFRKVPKQ